MKLRSERMKAVPITGLFLMCFVTTQSQAGKYELVKGKGVEVCEAYEKNLNYNNPKMPVRCLRSAHEELGFSKPEWEKLLGHAPIPTGVNIPDKVDRFLWERDANPVYHFLVNDWPKWRGTKAQRENAWQSYKRYREDRAGIPSPVYSEIDINNDGKIEPVYFERWCSFGTLLLVLKPDYSDIDHDKTKLVMPHPSRKEAGWGELRPVKKGDWGVPPSDIERGFTVFGDSLHGAHYDVFFFKNKAYFDLWWRDHPHYQGQPDFKVGRLRVYMANQDKTTEICTYRFDTSDK